MIFDVNFGDIDLKTWKVSQKNFPKKGKSPPQKKKKHVFLKVKWGKIVLVPISKEIIDLERFWGDTAGSYHKLA